MKPLVMRMKGYLLFITIYLFFLKKNIYRVLKIPNNNIIISSNIELIRTQNDEIVSLFPSHLKILCYVNIKTWWHQLEDAKRIRGEPPIEMNGNWIRRLVNLELILCIHVY